MWECWVPEGNLALMWQGQSGQSGVIANLVQSGECSLANLANPGWRLPILEFANLAKSPNWNVRKMCCKRFEYFNLFFSSVWQSGRSSNLAPDCARLKIEYPGAGGGWRQIENMPRFPIGQSGPVWPDCLRIPRMGNHETPSAFQGA